ncbi:sugar phosphotransferase, partial [Streptomyces sp. OF1]|nr:sugar phosphotransferase [Streptomyces alkaliterrae]
MGRVAARRPCLRVAAERSPRLVTAPPRQPGRTAPRPGAPAPELPTHRNPEAAPLLRLYRRVVPLRARRAVAGKLSLGARATLKRSLATSQLFAERAAVLRAERARRRAPDLFSGDERRLVLVRQRPRAARIRDYPRPLQAHTEALRLVCDTLAAAGVDHFCVRTVEGASTAVGVPRAERRRALRALTRMCEETAGYLVLPRRRRGGRRGRRVVPYGSPAARRWLNRASEIRFGWYYTDRSAAAATGERYGCTVEFWTKDDETGELVAPRRNRCTETVPADAPRIEVPQNRFSRLLPADAPPLAPVRTVAPFAHPLADDVSFPVDAVYTWVNGADPAWLRKRAEYAGEAYHEEAANAARYLSRDELRYSLRSLHQYAPWIRHVYLVTDDQTPEWLDDSHPGITVVGHRDIFTDRSLLPTFNSHAIESQLHHIDGLAEHFLYLNDDVFFGRLTTPQDFFLPNGLTRFFLSRAQIPFDDPSPEDVPIAAAGKNNRAVLEERFGVVITQKMKHVPHALRRSVLEEIEKEFADRHRTTAGNRFRALNDLSVTSSLHHYYAFLTGRAVPGRLHYDYFDMAHPYTPARLGRLLATQSRTVFCLNDTVSDETDLASQLAVMRPFLQSYFPFPSPYERQDD